MQPGPLLSLIVPFYNVARYFAQLLDSIEEQLTEQIQVILICDGATDGSLELAQQHICSSARPESYLLLCQANAGVSLARNAGLAKAEGGYIGFIDADDIVLPGYISNVLAVITEHQPDLIELGYKRFTDAAALNHAKERYLHRNQGWLEKHKAVKEVYQSSRWFPWLRIYRKNLMPDFQFPPGTAFCEDVMAMPALYQAAERLYHLRLPLYGYREHCASASFHVKTEHQQQLQSFFNALRQKHSLPALSERLRYILLFHLAYLLYKLQLSNQTQHSYPAELNRQSKALIRKVWWWPGFSLRKKLHLAFAPFFFQRHRSKG